MNVMHRPVIMSITAGIIVSLALAVGQNAMAADKGDDKGDGRMTQSKHRVDTIKTSAGDLKIGFIGHATLILGFNRLVIHVDPVAREANYTNMPKADIVLVTHGHSDHFDTEVIAMLRRKDTVVVVPPVCAAKVPRPVVIRNGETKTVHGVKIEAIPAYNLVHKRKNGQPFHPKGEGNGYIITFGDKRVYVAGDTENTPEMKALKNIDIAFLPMNVPYTMTPAMVADAARAFRPAILYPYHYSETDPQDLVKLLAADKNIEVRVRDMR